MTRRALLWAGAALCAGLFLADAVAIHEHWLRALDEHMLKAWRRSDARHALIGPPWALKAVVGITTMGAGVTRAPLTIAAVLVLALRGRGQQAALLGGTVAAGAVALPLLKLCFDRPRPDFLWHLVTENSWSFPSGHAMGSMILYPLLGGIAGATRGHGRAVALAGLGVALSLAVGATRVMLGVHWVSDVIGGWLIGAAFLCAALAIATPKDRRRS
ncbi:undecaprenyl-diphosphatase [Sphingomonas vulcanisoli]|uniref:Undecaprenyl-diphosphatase n=1 Tax=Sphingomonas vulcanisoli TaxID=1658060 RepID=A0ABX0TQ74_9SPHN|nr:phosphatase PAP2 family protein [Sphingomonas vulcanisoli]NIJ07688.1 undecaprenyl-diphosphatase [Sphingomonas vulcanisoli]